MIKQSVTLLLCIVLTTVCASAQSQLTFIGKLSIKYGEDYSYQLQATDSNGILSGYTVTDIMGPDETKTAITGIVNEDKSEITFHETKLLSTKSTAEKSDFCYIYGHVKISESHGITMLKGHFTGYARDGKTILATGKLNLASTTDVIDKLTKLQHKGTEAPPPPAEKEIVYKEEKAIPESRVAKVGPGNTYTVTCPFSTATIEVWDAETIDSDIITLLQDGTTVLENYTLTGRHKQLTINTGSKPATTLTLIAISEGTEPLNTARIKISCSGKDTYLDATTTMGKNVVIELRK